MLTEETPAETASFRLSPQQEHLWRTHPNGPPLTVRCAIDVGGAETTAVENALARAIARHEILRTTFLRRQGMRLPGQVIHERLEPAWAADDPVDLARGPVVPAALSGRGGGRRLLTLTVPAVCADARSLALLAEELRTGLGAQTGAGTEPLQYADYAEWRNELLAGEEAKDGRPGRDAGRSAALPFASRGAARSGRVERVPIPLAAAAVTRDGRVRDNRARLPRGLLARVPLASGRRLGARPGDDRRREDAGGDRGTLSAPTHRRSRSDPGPRKGQRWPRSSTRFVAAGASPSAGRSTPAARSSTPLRTHATPASPPSSRARSAARPASWHSSDPRRSASTCPSTGSVGCSPPRSARVRRRGCGRVRTPTRCGRGQRRRRPHDRSRRSRADDAVRAGAACCPLPHAAFRAS